MPKNIWTTKRRKKNRKGKSSDSEPDAETIERSRMLDPNEPSISIGRISDLFINVPVKIEEEVIYPDTRFQRSTTLFPAEVVEDEISPGIPNKTFKRSAEDELISAMPKKERMSDPSTTIKSTTSDDCMIIENTKKRVKIEVVDLTDDSHPIVPILCSPVKISHRENGQPDKTNTILPAIGDINVKFEPSDKRTEIIVDAAGSESVSYRTIQTNAEQNKTSESNSEVNTDRTYIDLPIDNTSCIQVKTEKNMSSESDNNDESFFEHYYVQIKAKKGMSSECNNNINLENAHDDARKDANSTTGNIHLRSEMIKENEDNRGINITIKMKQNENCIIDANSTSLSNFSFDSNTTDIYPVDRPIKSEQSKTNENCEKVDSQKIINSNNKNTCLVTSPTSIRNELNRINISPFPDGSIFSEDALLYEPGSFRTPLLKYLNCNTKVEVLEISNALSSLVSLIKETAEINAIESELIADPIDSQNKSELFLVEKGEELSNLRENQKQSLKIDEILNKISSSNFIELVDLKPSITNLSQLEKSINEEQVQSLLNNKGLIDETRQTNSPQILFKSHPKVSESSVKRWNQVAEKKGDSEANEKESLNVEDILYKISLPNFTESKLKPNITNLDSNSAIQFENSINEKEIQSPLNGDGLVDEMRQNISPMPNDSNLSESIQDSDSHTIYFNSPMDIENFPEDKSPSIICLSSLDENERNASSSNSPVEKKNNFNEYFPTDLLRQIIGNAKSTEKSDITDYSSLLKLDVGPVAKSNAIIDGSFLRNLHQIRFPNKKPVEIVNFTTDVKEKNSKNTVKNSGNFSAVPPKNVKRSHSVHLNPSTTCGDAVQTSSKRLKISEDESISKSGSVNKLGYEEYKKDIRKMASPHYSPDHLFSNYLGPDILSKSPNSSLGASSFGHNILATPTNSHNSSLPVCAETSLQSPVYPHLVNISSPQDPRLAHNYSRAMEKDVNSQKQLVSFNISQTCPSQNNPDVTNLPVYPLMNQLASASTTYAMPNFSRVLLTPAELFGPTINAMQIQQVEQMLPHMNSFQPHYLNQQTSMNNSNVFSSPVSESISFCMAQYNLQQSVQGVRDQQPFLSLLNMPGDISSPSQYHYSVSQEIPPPTSRHDTLSFDNYSSESVNYGFGLNPPLPDSIPPPPPPLPLTPPPIVEHPHSIASNISPRSLFHNNKKLAAAKNLSMPNQPSSKFLAPKPSLLPKDLREDIGKNIIQNNDFYLIIIERNIDWIHGIDKDVGIPRIAEIGGEFQQVRNIYRNHLVYYNTYFPLLLLECFSKISMALKAAKQKEKKDRNICKIIQCETKQNYVSLTCDSFVRHSDMDSIPKDGHIILVKFAAFREGNVRMLGYVCSSATRSYSHRHDRGNEILKYVNVNKRTDLIKIRVNFYIVFEISDINLDVPIHVSKLLNIKKALLLNDALKELRRSPLCDAILGLRNNNIKNFVLPRRQDTNAMTTVVQEIVQSLSPLSSQLTIVKSALFADSFLAIVQIVEEIRKSKMPGKILVCVRSEMLCQMGMNLMETSSNVVIINRERESVHEKLHSRVLDVMISHVATARNISDDLAKIKVLQEAEVLLAVTGNCFYEDVQSLARDLAFCIMHDAHSFTEPETLLPLLYGIRHLLLFGDPDESCTVNSKCSASLGYNKSLFHRAYNLC